MPLNKDYRTEAIVLRRTNYGEADRIIDFLTPNGVIGVMARAVRREKSKLAGGIEPFCLTNITFHEGKGTLATLTSAKMIKFYQNILKDFDKTTFAYRALKKISLATRQVSAPEYFDLLRNTFEGLNDDFNFALCQLYFELNLARVNGEEPNFLCDSGGRKLLPGTAYTWDFSDQALTATTDGPIVEDDIKILRLILSSPLALVARVKYSDYTKLLHELIRA